MKRFVVVVLDSFGVGAMDDCPTVRPADVGTNTAWHLINNGKLYLPALQKLGIMNAVGRETDLMKKNLNANYAVSKLMHMGADTYLGHQEIMGTKPQAPVFEAFKVHLEETEQDLINHGYKVRRHVVNGNVALVVNDGIFIGDNMETDRGQVINVSGTFSLTDFETVKRVGKIVRKHYGVSRIIALGGEDVPFENILNSVVTVGDFIGLDTPKTGVYNKGYLVSHIGLGVDESKQVIHALHERDIPTYLYGKVADIVGNEHGVNFFGVDTAYLMDKLLEDVATVDNAFFCLNVQETDLAGHRCNPEVYSQVLKIADEKLTKLVDLLDEDDVLIVMADHGNDPYSGSSLHSRERVPVLIHNQKFNGKCFGERQTMADVGQTVAKYFGTCLENGLAIF